MADERYIALGNMAEGIAGALQKKADTKHQEESDRNKMIAQMVSKGIESGTIKDPDAAFQFLISGGKPGGKKKQELPPMLKQMIGSTKHLFGGGEKPPSEADQVAGRMASAQKPQQSSTGGQPGGGAPGIHFLSGQERDDASLEQQKKVNTQITQPNADLQSKRRIAEIEAQGKNRPQNPLMTKIQNGVEAYKAAHEGQDPPPEEYNKIIDEARAGWQAAGKTGTDYKQFETTWLKDATEKAGHALSAGEQKKEMLLARKAWSLQETSADKLSRAKALEKYKKELSGTDSDIIKQLSQSVTIGDKTRGYFDLGSVSGAKEKNEAAKAAIEQGLIPVSPKQAEQLEAAGAANANLTGFLDQVKSKLPADAASRPLTTLENKLSTIFQTDDELSSAVSWDTTVLPLLRAMQVSGRITNLEFQTALNSRPKITDTVGVASKKVGVITKILGNSADQILNRGQAVTAGGPKAGASSTGAVPAKVTALLKGKKQGHYKLSDGAEYDVSADGTVTASKKAS